jgi:prephenate dehydrogenase
MSPDPTIAILGPGLLGGSIALAARQHLPEARIHMWGRREEAVADLKARGIADMASTDAKEVVRDAWIVVLAVPVPAMKATLEPIMDSLDEGAIVTDVGSVKVSVLRDLEPLFAGRHTRFVGSHPMAGSEESGIQAARSGLFEGATCLLTPTPSTDADALYRIESFWQVLGCKTKRMDAPTHDRQVARISHMPHAMAYALSLAALRSDPHAVECAGNGFRDSTRIAASDPDLWTGILLENRDEVIAALEDAAARVQDVLALVRANDKEPLRAFLAEAQQLRKTLPNGAAHNHGTD